MKVGAASTRRAMNRSESESSLSSESELSDDEVSPLSRRASGCRPLPLAARCPLPAAALWTGKTALLGESPARAVWRLQRPASLATPWKTTCPTVAPRPLRSLPPSLSPVIPAVSEHQRRLDGALQRQVEDTGRGGRRSRKYQEDSLSDSESDGERRPQGFDDDTYGTEGAKLAKKMRQRVRAAQRSLPSRSSERLA